MTASLFERLGGAGAVDAAVDIFYTKVMADASLRPFFGGVDLERMRSKQKGFLTYAFGGPQKYNGKGLRHAHARLVKQGLNGGHFAAVAGHLQATLEELKVPPLLIQEVMAIAGSTKADVLGE